MIFRAFWGEPCHEAVELEHGHLAHADVPTNPANGEVEDTEVGFPGPEHAIAERELPMKVAMGLLAVLAVVGGVLQIPGVDHVLSQLPLPRLRRLAPVRPRALDGQRVARPDRRADRRRRRHRDLLPAVRRQARSAARTAGAPRADPHVPRQQVVLRRADRLRDRPPGPRDRAADRVGARADRDRRRGHERRRRRGAGRSAGIRRAQTGFLRYYAAAVVLGLSAVALYFLIVS